MPIQVRDAQVGVYWVALQPAGGARVIGTGAHMVQAYLWYPLIPIRPVPGERLVHFLSLPLPKALQTNRC